MIETSKITLMIIAVVGLGQAAFLMLLLRHEGKRAFRANRWLMVFAGAACLSFIEDITDVILDARLVLLLAPLFMAAVFAFVPSIYLYFREIADRPVEKPILHFAPLGPVFIAMSVVVWILFAQFVPDIIQQDGIDIDSALDQHLPLTVLIVVVFAALYIQLFIYMPKIWKVALAYLLQAKEQLGADQNALRRWTLEILIGITTIFVIFTLASLIDVFVADGTWLTTFVQGSFVLVFFRLCHLMASTPTLFVQAEWQQGDDGTVGEKDPSVSLENADAFTASDTAKPFLDEEDVVRIRDRLNRIVDETDLLFDPLLSLPKLASAVGATPNQLSYVLNQHLDKKFFDFINEARTREASRLLVEHPERTVLDIATSVGFNSKSTFNLAFKKITGKTPSAYRQQNLEKITI